MDCNVIDQIENIKNSYHSKISLQINELKSGWNSFCRSRQYSTLSDLYQLAHSLAGSAGIFGCPRTGVLCREMCDMLVESLDNIGLLHIELLAEQLDLIETVAMIELDDNKSLRSSITFSESEWQNLLESKCVLIVDDEKASRHACVEIIRAMGAQTIEAGSGEQAIDMFREYDPDIVIMDVVMPDMYGFEATAKIKRLAGDRLLPVVFVSSLSESSVVSHCIQKGGDDFLFKPISKDILRVKMLAMLRIIQNDEGLELLKQKVRKEFGNTREMFNELFSQYKQSIPNVACWQQAVGEVSGDVKLFRKVGDNKLYGILGDMTGHGVPAAVGGIVVSEVFCSMAEKHFYITDIARELNSKLAQTLPKGHYCAAIILSLECDSGRLELLNCGLPAARVFNDANTVVRTFQSSHLPLGISISTQDILAPESGMLGQGDRLIMFTDGIVELRKRNGAYYSDEQLVDDIQHQPQDEQLVDYIKRRLHGKVDLRNPADDISVVEVHLQ